MSTALDDVVESFPLAGVLLTLGVAEPGRANLQGDRVEARLTLLPDAVDDLRQLCRRLLPVGRASENGRLCRVAPDPGARPLRRAPPMPFVLLTLR